MSSKESGEAADRTRPGGSRPRVRIFLEGRYRKFVRDLPQTIFWCPRCKGRRGGCKECGGYGKLTRDSVQELIQRKVLKAFRSWKGKFHGCGREDIDVRMLGGGRPFVFEVIDPREREVDLAELERRINEYGRDRIEVEGLHLVERKRVAYLKQTPYDKLYRLTAECAGEPDPGRLEEIAGARIQLVQRTPGRVAHRRADKERKRMVTIRSAASTEAGLVVEVRAEHGTYIKEWVSGDEGRTTPSLGDLVGTNCLCRELDVLDILERRT